LALDKIFALFGKVDDGSVVEGVNFGKINLER